MTHAAALWPKPVAYRLAPPLLGRCPWLPYTRRGMGIRLRIDERRESPGALLAICLLVLAPSVEAASPAPQGPDAWQKCPFTVDDGTVDELRRRLERGLGPFEQAVCAAAALHSRDPQRRPVGLDALIQLGGPASKELRGLAGAAQVNAATDDLLSRVVQRLISLLSSSDWNVRGGAAYFLGVLGDRAAIPSLADRVSDPEGNVRQAVVGALRKLADPITLAPLVKATRDVNYQIGLEAVGGVAAIGGREAVTALIGVVEDQAVDVGVRNRAAWELRDLKDPAGLKAAERHFASQGAQWQRGFYFAPLLYALAFWAARKEQVRPKLWGFVLYLSAMASMLAVVGLFVFPQGMVQQTYVLTLLAYPMGLLLGAALVAAGLWGRGVEPGITQGFVRRIAVCLPLMWGTVVAWYALAWVLTAVKFMLAWR